MDGAARLPQRRPIEALTGLRFVAALIVVVSHLPQIIPIDWLQEALGRQGAAGVTIFFVLSGFVLAYNYAEFFRTSTTGALHFMRARIARIWPINVVSLIITTLLLLWWGNPPSPVPWVVNLLMLQALVPTQAMLFSWNPPAWSVSCELIFYCSFPFFLYGVLTHTRSVGALLRLAAALFVIQLLCFCVVAVAADYLLHQSGRSASEISWTLDRIKSFPGLRIWEFFLGCVLGLVLLQARVDSDGWWRVLDRRRIRDAMLVACGLGLLVTLVLTSAVDPSNRNLLARLASVGLYVVYTPLAVLLVTAIAWGPTTINPLLERRWVLRLGEASYSFYMLQWNVILIAIAISGGAPTWFPLATLGWGQSAAAIIALTFISLASAGWIELPTRRFLRGGAPYTRPAVPLA
jgi:peptidoglycan/LPS O-acetylase OafA/YrhL